MKYLTLLRRLLIHIQVSSRSYCHIQTMIIGKQRKRRYTLQLSVEEQQSSIHVCMPATKLIYLNAKTQYFHSFPSGVKTLSIAY